ncbi:tripartite tricarboxylate transporter permease [Blastococcus sp. HT6-30]|uniref:tripartite tricarboxylate transporter permease n=1 Tax=Blastococcus sp. HT6-30 TaxID=3144843 RepID=UPI00321A33EB
MGNLTDAALMILDPTVLLVILLSAIYGLFMGAIPGLTATLATALLVPFAFFLEPVAALASIITMSAMAIFAGDIPSALVRMPGTPASAAYTDDAYFLTRQGKGDLALGIGLVGSAVAGIMGSVVLILAAPIVAEFALQFTSFEYFWFAVLGLSTAVVISRGSQVKGVIALSLGLLLGTVGLDPTMGFPRFTFGSDGLLGGINFIPAMIGLFGLSEVLRNVLAKHVMQRPPRIDMKGFWRRIGRHSRRESRHMLRGGAIGSVVGALPGAGGDVAAWVSYGTAKNGAKEPGKFGKGSTEGIAAAGSANNSSLASAWVPTLTLGIPGDTITAILIGVLYLKGLTPGPAIFRDQPELVTAVYLIFILANLLLIPLGYLAIRMSGFVLRVPRHVLLPVIVVFCVVGSYSVNNSLLGIWVMLGMGIVGFLMERAGIPLAPVVLGLVLGPIVERNFTAAVTVTNWDLAQFFTRPVSAALIVAVLLTWMWPLFSMLRGRMKGSGDRPRDGDGQGADGTGADDEPGTPVSVEADASPSTPTAREVRVDRGIRPPGDGP